MESRNQGTGKIISFVSNNCWSIYNFRAEVIRRLLDKGFRVVVIAPEDDYSGALVQMGCTYYPVSFSNKSLNPLADIRFYFQLRRLYKKVRPAFVFHYVIKPNIYGSVAAASLGIPSVAIVTGLGYAFDRKNWLYMLVKKMYRYALRKAGEVWFLNNEDARAFREDKIVPAGKMKVLHGEGVNTEYFSPQFNGVRRPNEKFTFLMSTRLLRSKGVAVYADAARILRNKNLNLRFDLLGFFEKQHPDSITAEQIRRWEEEGLIRYNGFVKDVRPFLLQADCFVFPSFYHEGVPRSLMEAASMELPIITSINRGCKEVVLNNSTGFLCNPNDPFDLAEKMEKMIRLSPDFRKRMGQHGRLLVMRKFNVERVIMEYERTLNRL